MDSKTPVSEPVLLTSDNLPGALSPVAVGTVLFVVHTEASNLVKDVRENIRNLVGGRMQHYEKLIEHSVSTALDKMRRRLSEEQWDGAYAVRISHPSVVDGGCEVIVYGTPFRAEGGG